MLHDCTIDYNDLKIKYGKQQQKLQQTIDVFSSEKNYTYNMLYYANFNKNPSDDDSKIIQQYHVPIIPELFSVQFCVFLFLDGKDFTGKTVRQRILDSDDDICIYTILYEILILKTNVSDCGIVEYDNIINEFVKFRDQIPPTYKLISKDKIMDKYKQTDNIMFKVDTVEKCA